MRKLWPWVAGWLFVVAVSFSTATMVADHMWQGWVLLGVMMVGFIVACGVAVAAEVEERRRRDDDWT